MKTEQAALTGRLATVGILIATFGISSMVALARHSTIRSLGDADLARHIDHYEDETPATKATYRALEVLSYVWIFCIAATIASFLNVVVYRFPRGMEFVRTPSHCPNCNARIRATDNIPVLGWVRLRGKCRDCGLPISARYPLVEAIFGLSIVALASVELLSGGANLPLRDVNRYSGVVFVLWAGTWDLLAIFAYHLSMYVFLTVTALIQWDLEPLPISWPAVGVAIGILTPLFWPQLHLVPAYVVGKDRWFDRTALSAATDGVAGLATGMALGMIGRRGAASMANNRRDDTGYLAGWSIIGAFLGWQAVAGVAIICSVYELAFNVVCRPMSRVPTTHFPASMAVVFLSGALLCFWRDLSRWLAAPSWIIAAALIACALLAVMALAAVSRAPERSGVQVVH